MEDPSYNQTETDILYIRLMYYFKIYFVNVFVYLRTYKYVYKAFKKFFFKQ